MDGSTLQEFLTQTTRRLSAHSETPLLDAQVLAAHILQQSHSWVMAYPEYEISDLQLKQLNMALKRYEQKAQAAKVETSSSTKQSGPAKSERMTFEEAFQQAKRDLSGRK